MNNKITLIYIFLFTTYLNAQCAYDNVFYNDLTPPSQGSTVTETCIWGGDYITVSVVAGDFYTFSTCTTLSVDTEISLYDNTGAIMIAFNDDYCGLQSEIQWTATFTGVVHVLIDEWDAVGNPCQHAFNCIELVVTHSAPLSIDENILFKAVSIYPNPNNGKFTLNYEGTETLIGLTVLDITGNTIQIFNFDSYNINYLMDLSHLAKGMYFLKIQTNNAVATKRVVIN